MGLNMYVNRINKIGTLKEITKSQEGVYNLRVANHVERVLKIIIKENTLNIKEYLDVLFNMIDLDLETLKKITKEVNLMLHSKYNDKYNCITFMGVLLIQDSAVDDYLDSFLEDLLLKNAGNLLDDVLAYKEKYENMKKNGAVISETLTYFRKNYFVRNIIEEICKKNRELLLDDCYCNVILSEDNIKYIYNSLVEKKLYHITVAAFDAQYEINSILLNEGIDSFKYILDTTDFNNETIQYYDC